MKLVVLAQHRENYGAHDWDGQGECPQYWKCKGTTTYVVDITLAQARDKSFYDAVYKHIEYLSDYSEEYIASEYLIDDIDYQESDVVDFWDTPIQLVYANGRFLATRYTEDHGKLEQWVQLPGGDRAEYSCTLSH